MSTTRKAGAKSGGASRKKTSFRGKSVNYDLHNHVIPPAVIDAIIRNPERFGTRIEERDGKRYFDSHGRMTELLPEFCDAEAKIAWMDRVGLGIAAISVGPPIYFYWLKAEYGIEAARLANEGIARMVAQHPDRLRGMAHLPMQDPDAAISELERAVKEYGFKAVELGTSIEGVALSDARFRKVLKAIERLGCFVFAHPYQCLAQGGMDDYYLRNFIGFPLDTTLMVAHLMFSGALDELKKLRVLLAHGGGYIPYQIGRFVHGHRVRPEPKVNNVKSPREHFKRFYFDCLTHEARSTRHLINMVGADHVVIGTDNPFDMAPASAIGQIDAVPGLTAVEREWICMRTARKLLGEK
ncbi:MAG TPA: amidohydrolase family protein [Burkholderiales bacterium]|nr:amidohydrolase family protein [Burkholderiales bacterium]